MRKFLFLLLFGLCYHQLYSQTKDLDSLKLVLSKLETKDITYVNVVNDIAFRLSIIDPQQSIYYINLALSVAKELSYEEGLLRATTIKGNSFLIIGMPDQALSYYLEALNYNPENYPLEQVRLNNNIGEVFRRKKVYDSSLKYFNRALQLAIENVDDYKPVIIYSNLGEISLMQGQIEEAKDYFNKCLKNSLAENHIRGQGYGYFGLAECAFISNNTHEAIDLMKRSIGARQEAKHQRGVIYSYLKLGSYFQHSQADKSDSAIFYWKKAEMLAREYETKDLLVEAFNHLYGYYLDQSDLEKAAYYMDLHKNLADSIRNAEFISNVDKMKSALSTELVNAENQLLKQERLQSEAEEDARLIVVVLAFLIVLGLAVATYQYRHRQKASKEAENESQFTETLLTLSNDLNSNEFNLEEFINKLLALSQKTLGTDRATYRRFDQRDESLYIQSKAQNKRAEDIPVVTIQKDEILSFFNEFLSNRTVAITNVSKESRLSELYGKYFKSIGIESVLSGPILIDGSFEGFISYAMTNKQVREWNMQEQRYVASLADLIVVAIGKHKGNILKKEKEELISKLRSRNKSLHEFNSVISHNLREPLTQIIGLSDLLKDDQGNGESEEIVRLISDSSNRIDKVIKELSTVLNETEPKPSDFRLLSIERLVKEVLDLLKNEIKSRKVTIEQVFETTKIRSFKAYLIDAMYHLLSNSLKFADPEKRLHIKIHSYEDDLKQYIVISDNGRGMNLERFGDKIFKMYQRYHIDVEGRGIGLFIVKNRINVLNGLVSLESTEGVGTTVKVEFPKFSASLN